MQTSAAEFEAILATMRRTAALLRDADIAYALAGSVAGWARGGPETCNDLDFLVAPQDAERAQRTLADAGLRPEQPPEGWLLKAYNGDTLVDLIFELSSGDRVEDVIARAETLRVASVEIPVTRMEDVLVAKLWSFDEHTLDFADTLQAARSLREQIDWGQVRARTDGSPYARAFLALLDGLGVTRPEAVSG
jgi:hypothetical protein